jgi:hypothetical protein
MRPPHIACDKSALLTTRSRLRIRYTSTRAAPLATQALLGKSLDVAMVPVEVQVNAMVKGAAIKAFAGGNVNNVFLIIVRNDVVISGCADRGVEALPASPASVAAFLAAMAERGLRPATIARRCAAVRHYHRLVGVDPLPTDAAIVKTTMKGLRRSLGAAQAKKAPATATIAKRMTDAIPDVH